MKSGEQAVHHPHAQLRRDDEIGPPARRPHRPVVADTAKRSGYGRSWASGDATPVCSSTGTTSTPADPDVVALLSAGENRTEVTQLTTREREVLTELAYGRSNLEIARLFGVSEKTVKTHVSATLRKLAVHDRTQAALHAMRAGLVDS